MSRSASLLFVILWVSFVSLPAQSFDLCSPNLNSASTLEGGSGAATQSLAGCEDDTPTTPGFITVPTTSSNGEIAISWGISSSTSNFRYIVRESKDGAPYTEAYSEGTSGSRSTVLSGRGDGSYQ